MDGRRACEAVKTISNLPWVDIATTLRIGRFGIRFPVGSEIFLFSHSSSRPALVLNQPPIHWLPGSVPQVNRPNREADCCIASSVGVQNDCSYIFAHPKRLHEDPRFLGYDAVNEAI